MISMQQVKSSIRDVLVDGCPSLGEVAVAMDTSPRTLQRRLEELGVTFTDLIDEERFNIARRLMKQDDLRLGDVAKRLGYADASSFTRAFSRWSGMPPKEFRKARLNS